MGSIWTLITIVGPILLIAAIIYAWKRNRDGGARNLREAERGAQRLQEDIAHDREP